MQAVACGAHACPAGHSIWPALKVRSGGQVLPFTTLLSVPRQALQGWSYVPILHTYLQGIWDLTQAHVCAGLWVPCP